MSTQDILTKYVKARQEGRQGGRRQVGRERRGKEGGRKAGRGGGREGGREREQAMQTCEAFLSGCPDANSWSCGLALLDAHDRTYSCGVWEAKVCDNCHADKVLTDLPVCFTARH